MLQKYFAALSSNASLRSSGHHFSLAIWHCLSRQIREKFVCGLLCSVICCSHSFFSGEGGKGDKLKFLFKMDVKNTVSRIFMIFHCEDDFTM